MKNHKNSLCLLFILTIVFVSCTSQKVRKEESFSNDSKFAAAQWGGADYFDGQIMGQGQADIKTLAQFLLSENPALLKKTAVEIAFWYVEEAGKEGVNHDVAFAQMCLETSFLRFGNQVAPTQNNFCGLGATDDGAAGCVFPDIRTGVRAHVQHLKAYASTDELTQELVDPRFKYVKRGQAPHVDALAGSWASDRAYGEKIRRVVGRVKRMSLRGDN